MHLKSTLFSQLRYFNILVNSNKFVIVDFPCTKLEMGIELEPNRTFRTEP